MFIPNSVRQVLNQTVALAKENDRDVPDTDRMHDDESYEETEKWLSQFEAIPNWESTNAVEIHCTEIEPGDLFRPVTPEGVENTNDWKLFLEGEMTPNETWYYGMAYADPETGIFEGIHQAPDCDPVEVITMCRACGDQQGTQDAEVKVEGATIAGPVCETCYRNYPALPNTDSA